jgi:aspartate aminotransferase
MRAAGTPVIDLGAGEPDFATPSFVMEAARCALDAGATRYTQVEGIPPLRETSAQRANAIHPKGGIEAGNVVVSAGTSRRSSTPAFSLFRKRRRSARSNAWMAEATTRCPWRARQRSLCGARSRQLKVTPDDLLAAATREPEASFSTRPATRPALYSRDELADIVACAESAAGGSSATRSTARSRMTARRRHCCRWWATRSPLSSWTASRSRVRCLTGWRIGWSIASAPLSRGMAALQSYHVKRRDHRAARRARRAVRR